MARERMQFDEEAMKREYGNNLEAAKTGGSNSFGIFKDLPKWEFFKFEAGKKYTVRFIPWNENNDSQKPRWFLKVPVHKYVGPKENARDYVCLGSVGKTCPLCEELERKASYRYFYNIRHKTDSGQFEPAIVEVNRNFHDALVKVSETTNPDTGMVKTVFFMSPDNGSYVGFAGEEVRRGDFKWIEPGRVGFGEPSKIDKKWFDEAVDLHTHVRLFSAKQLSEALYGQHPEEPDTGLENTSAPVARPVIPEVSLAEPAVERTVTPAEPKVDLAMPKEPEAPSPRRDTGVKMCSKGFPFGDPAHAKKHKACETCPDAEYNECVQVAGSK